LRSKYHIKLALAILFLFAWTAYKHAIVPTQVWAGDPPQAGKQRAENPSITQRFLGERLDYYLGFFLFSKAADCVIDFQGDEPSGRYVAKMWAKTRGFIGWLTSYRENRYISHMEKAKDGRRLRPILFEKRVTIGSTVKESFHWFDYPARRINYAIIHNKRLIKEDCYDIPEGIVYEDILSAFYNLRAGVYGEIQKGQHYIIPSIPEKGIDRYTMEVLDDVREWQQRRKQGWKDNNNDFVLRVIVNREVFGTREGLIWIRMSKKNLIPLEGVAEDAIGLGDITGRLYKVSYISP
jgi:hypothetical protein